MIALIDSANKKKPASKLIDAGLDGGESGVRTHGPLKTSVFKTDAIDHSAISPKMEPEVGVEPTTPCLQNKSSTSELSGQFTYVT